MTKYRYLLHIALCFFFSNVFSQSNAAVFKSMQIAEYSAQREPDVSREVALAEKVREVKMFDASGNLSEHTRYQTKDLIYESINITWSKDSLLQTTITKDGEGAVKRVWESKWKKKGHILGATSKDAKGKVTLVQTNEYDTQGNMILRKMENVGSDKIGTTSFVYDANGNVVEETEYNPYRNKSVKRTFKYDELGNEVLQELFKEGGKYTKFVSENDAHGNLVEQCWYDKAGNLKSRTTFTYVYDQHGNWTTKKRATNGEVSYVWEREMVYW